MAVDAETGEVVASDLTCRRTSDPRRVPELLQQIDRPVASARADGAYDTDEVYEAFHEAGRGGDVRVLIPPPRRAHLYRRPTPAPRERNRNVRSIRKAGRVKW